MIFIHGVGHFHPENVIDNAFLTSLDIGTSDEWILERVGIRERRTALSLDYIRSTYNQNPMAMGHALQYSNAQTGLMAARMALERARLSPQAVGMVIAGGCLPQYSLPADACAIAAALGIEAPAFDINSACSSLAVQMHWLAHMRPEALPDYILLVLPENMTRCIDFKDRNSAVLWGDGSAALVVSTKIPARVSMTHSFIQSNPSGWSKVTVPAGGHFSQEGSAVQRFAIKTMHTSIDTLREEAQLDPSQHYFIGHQANLLALQSTCAAAHIAEDKHLYNVDQFGNTGASGAPIVFSQHWNHFKPQDTLIMVVVGAGLTWGGMIFQFEEGQAS